MIRGILFSDFLDLACGNKWEAAMSIAKYYINIKYYQCYYVVCLHGLVLFMWPMEPIVINSWLYATRVDVEVTTLYFCSHLVRWTPSEERDHPNGIALVLALPWPHFLYLERPRQNHSLTLSLQIVQGYTEDPEHHFMFGSFVSFCCVQDQKMICILKVYTSSMSIKATTWSENGQKI